MPKWLGRAGADLHCLLSVWSSLQGAISFSLMAGVLWDPTALLERYLSPTYTNLDKQTSLPGHEGRG